MDEFIIFQGHHYEQGKVHTARNVALENRVANVSAPHRQALALPLFEAAPTHDCPLGVAGKYPPARVHLVVDIHGAYEPTEPANSL